MYGNAVQVRTWQKTQRNLAIQKGFVRTMLGRCQRLPGALHETNKGMSHALYVASTTAIQVLPPSASNMHGLHNIYIPIQMLFAYQTRLRRQRSLDYPLCEDAFAAVFTVPACCVFPHQGDVTNHDKLICANSCACLQSKSACTQAAPCDQSFLVFD